MASVGFAVTAAICYATLVTLFMVWQACKTLEVAGSLSLAILCTAGAIACYPLLPAFRGVRFALAARRSVDAGNLIDARVATDDARNAVWISLGWSASIAVVLCFIQFLIANDLAVARTFFLVPLIVETLPLVLEAFWTNIYIFMVAEVLVLIVGLLVAIARLAPGKAGKPVRTLAILYADVFRGLPAVVTLYLVGFGLPLTGLPIVSSLPRETLAIIALTLTMSAYVSEVYRAGIESVHRSQTAAARSLGLSHFQTLRFVVVPQAVRLMIPPLLNSFIGLQKDTALLAIIGAVDAFNQAKIIAANHFNLSAVTTVAIIFVLITIPQTRLVDKLVERRRRAGGV
ncbi:amino acid ABC transporter permease [Cupriavidus taiwanensis]|nr:amino acid ABC transporter permease [Cupriavidus taiwanensis]